MSKTVILIHGGASEVTPFTKNKHEEIKKGLKHAVKVGNSVLEKGGTALKAVEKAVMILENDPLFNAGRGSALNNKGEVEMDAAIMDGKTLDAGAVSIVKTVKNPINLARVVMTRTRHILLSGEGALDLATMRDVVLEPESYFITQHQYENFLNKNKKCSRKEFLKKELHGTVGAVALDRYGNIASATSTGGTTNRLPGRIGDSCLIGAGCYANNLNCAVSATGEGEQLIRSVVAHTIAMLIELKEYSLQQACDEVIHVRNRGYEIGVIALNKKGQIGISFNTDIMRRAWKSSDDEHIHVKIYP